jgi:hypothetical protein
MTEGPLRVGRPFFLRGAGIPPPSRAARLHSVNSLPGIRLPVRSRSRLEGRHSRLAQEPLCSLHSKMAHGMVDLRRKLHGASLKHERGSSGPHRAGRYRVFLPRAPGGRSNSSAALPTREDLHIAREALASTRPPGWRERWVASFARSGPAAPRWRRCACPRLGECAPESPG